MDQTTGFQHVKLKEVSFHQPDEQTYHKLVTERIRKMKQDQIVLIVCAVLFGVLFAFIHPLVGLFVIALFAIAICGRQYSIRTSQEVGVRYGTVVDYYRKKIYYEHKDHSGSRYVYCTTIRLDDTRQIVHGVGLNPRTLCKEPIGIQILIAKYKDAYRFFPAESAEPQPEIPEPADAVHPYETTIDRVSLEEISPDTQKRVSHAIAKRKTCRRIFSSAVPVIFLGAFLFPFLQILTVMIKQKILICYLLFAAVAIGIYVLLYIRDLIVFSRVTGIPVQILNFDTNTDEVDFQVPATGQIVRKQHIRYYFCEPDQTDSAVLLVFHPNHEYSVFPPD